MDMIKMLTAAIVAAASATPLLQNVQGAVLAFDDASQAAYSNGWQAGDNGGTGFGPWTFSYSGNTNGLLYPPQFIDTAPALPGNTLGAPAFALTTGDRNNQFETSEVRRTFTAPLAVGETFSADVNGSALNPSAPAFTIGNTFDLLGTNGSERFSLLTNNEYHGGRWTATGDADTGIAPGNSFHIELQLLTANSYNLVLSPIGGGTPFFTQSAAPLAGTAGVAINRIRISDYGTGSSSDGSRELFVDNLAISGPDSIPGDFNHDNIVDAADYVVWRKNPAGTYTTTDFNNWLANFGRSAGSGTSSNVAVPEPASRLYLAVGVWAVTFRPRRERQHRCGRGNF
jgi:hypothetical protein